MSTLTDRRTGTPEHQPRTPGKVRATRVALWPADGRCRAELVIGLLAPRLVRHDAAGAQVALIASTATLLGGDDLRLDVEVGPGLRLDLDDVTGTVAYNGRGRGCRIDVTLTIHPGAVLSWSGQPLVVAAGADLSRALRVEVAEGGRLLMRDRVVLGRAGEPGGSLRCHTTMTYGGRPALVEQLDLAAPDTPGILGSARVVDSMTAIGWRPSSPAHGLSRVSVMSLDAPGALARTLVSAAHDSVIPALWTPWVGELDQTSAQSKPPARKTGREAQYHALE